MNPFVVIYFPNGCLPREFGQVEIGSNSDEYENARRRLGEIWPKLSAIAWNFPNPAVRDLVHKIEIYMPGSKKPSMISPEGIVYHDFSFLLTECCEQGLIRCKSSVPDKEGASCWEEMEAQAA